MVKVTDYVRNLGVVLRSVNHYGPIRAKVTENGGEKEGSGSGYFPRVLLQQIATNVTTELRRKPLTTRFCVIFSGWTAEDASIQHPAVSSYRYSHLP